MLYIDVTSGSLNRHYGPEGYQRVINDLRGCRVDKVNEEGRILLLIKGASDIVEVTLRPPVLDVEKWFAAFYRWRSVSRSTSNRSLKSTDSIKVCLLKIKLMFVVNGSNRRRQRSNPETNP